jgi:hypothetical protein
MDSGNMGLRNRLGRLEQLVMSYQGEAVKRAEEAISREALRRTTDDELRAYERALKRMVDGEERAPGDAAILARIQELREEVTSGYQTTPR